MVKKLVSLLLSLVIILTLFPVSVVANDVIASGYCGVTDDNRDVNWTLFSDGLLTIDGVGDIGWYQSYEYPWFDYKSEIRCINIGNHVTSVPSYAFAGCPSLTEVFLGGVHTIDGSAFEGCAMLSSITFPDTVESIGSMAFWNCDSLLEVNIGSEVNTIESNAFAECNALKVFHVDSKNPYYFADNYGVLFCKNTLELVQYPIGDARTEYMIPAGTTGIKAYAFSGCVALKNVIIPKDVMWIELSAFKDCLGLSSVTIPEGINSIVGNTFQGCVNLKEISIPKSLTHVDGWAFDGCRNLKDVYYSGDDSEWSVLYKNVGVNNFWFLAAKVFYNCSGGLRPSQHYSFGSSFDSTDLKFGVYEYGSNKPMSNADISYKGKHLTISLSNYESVDIPNCTLNSDPFNALALVPETLNSDICAVHCNGKDALINEVKILNTTKSFDVYVYGSGAKYQLFSDYPSVGNKIAESIDGHFSVNTAALTKGKSLYVRAVTSDGEIGSAIKTNIRVKEAFNSSVKLTNKFGVTVPDDVPLLGGSDFSIDIANLCPVSYTQEGNTIRFGLGCKENLLSKDNSMNWLNFKKAVDKMCNNWDKGDAMYGFAKSWSTNVSSSSPKFNAEFYGYCEVTLADDGSVSSWGGRLAIVVNGGWEGQWQTVVVAVPILIKFSAETSLGAGFSIGLDLEHASLYMDGDATLILPRVRASAGVGIAYVADVSVYGSGENKIKFTASKQGQRVTGTLSGEIGVGLSARCFSYNIPLLNGDWEYLNTGLFKAQSTLTKSSIEENVLNSSNYSIDRAYVDTQSCWYTEQPKKKRMLMSSGSNLASETTVQSSVYYSANPQLVITDNGTRIMVWTADIPERGTGNHLAVVYSVYDENSGTWATPIIVDNDGTLDCNVTAVAYGNNVYIAWSDAKSTDFTAETTMTEMTKALDISVAVYDTEMGNVNVSRLTDNAFADLRPMLCADESGIYATWVENSNADLLQMSGVNKIYYSAFDGNKWSEPVSYVRLDKPVVSLDSGVLGKNVCIAYTVDMDGSLATTEDVELFCGAIGASASVITDNESMEQNPQFVNWLGMPTLAWYGAEGICVYDGNNIDVYDTADTGIGANFAVENGHIISVQHSDNGSMLYSSDILNDKLGSSVAITNNADYIAAFSAESDENTIYVAFTKRSAIIEEMGITESTDLCIAEIKGFHDLALLDVKVDEADVIAGTTVPVTLTVKNNGLFDEDSILVTGTFDDEEKVSAVCDTTIAKGDTVEITVQLPLEDVIEPKTEYVFSIESVKSEDRNKGDNSSCLILGYADLQLTAELIGSGDTKIALIDVANLSGIDTNAILHIYNDDEERTQLAAYDIGTIASGTHELYEINSSLLPQLRETNKNLYFTVEADIEEQLTGDNSAFLYLQTEEKELRVTVSVNGNKTEMQCLTSVMNQIAVSVYDLSGKMLSMKTVDYDESCEEVIVTINDTTIPQDNIIKMFFLDKKWRPVSSIIEIY